jgi:hypothetical protein
MHPHRDRTSKRAALILNCPSHVPCSIAMSSGRACRISNESRCSWGLGFGLRSSSRSMNIIIIHHSCSVTTSWERVQMCSNMGMCDGRVHFLQKHLELRSEARGTGTIPVLNLIDSHGTAGVLNSITMSWGRVGTGSSMS